MHMYARLDIVLEAVTSSSTNDTARKYGRKYLCYGTVTIYQPGKVTGLPSVVQHA